MPDTGGVVFVPALTGLGAPHWDPDARGAILGITRGTTRAHLVRATLEAIAFEVRDVVDVMTSARPAVELPELPVDGGAAPTTCCCSCRPTSSASPVRRPVVLETTALGRRVPRRARHRRLVVDRRAGATWRLDRRFEPGPDGGTTPAYGRWRTPSTAPGSWAT